VKDEENHMIVRVLWFKHKTCPQLGAREVTVKVPKNFFQSGCRLLGERVGWEQTISANEQKDLQTHISKKQKEY
jgi:hypothetical protein